VIVVNAVSHVTVELAGTINGLSENAVRKAHTLVVTSPRWPSV